MGSAISNLKKVGQSWNFANRAQREVQRQKKIPKTSPRHKTSVKIFDNIAKEHPEHLEAQRIKNEELIERLKHVRVESFDPQPEPESEHEDATPRQLPMQRAKLEEQEFGYKEPKKIKEGYVSLKQGFDFLSKRSLHPDDYDESKIAEEYKLDVKNVEKVLSYFKMCQFDVPDKLLEKHPHLRKHFEKKAKKDDDPSYDMRVPSLFGMKASEPAGEPEIVGMREITYDDVDSDDDNKKGEKGTTENQEKVREHKTSDFKKSHVQNSSQGHKS